MCDLGQSLGGVILPGSRKGDGARGAVVRIGRDPKRSHPNAGPVKTGCHAANLRFVSAARKPENKPFCRVNGWEHGDMGDNIFRGG
ncbi:hypothetical protein AA3271_1477 [Gluconobacter japonicus NBRC 3271]|nr:hypothetical protein AA3271_1477 [Gluconobacter japonicus NBRC 3271]